MVRGQTFRFLFLCTIARMLIQFPALAHPALVHAVTTRAGGVSQPPLDTLNLSWARPDDPAAVLHNRLQVCAALGIALDDVVQAGQVHKTLVRAVGSAERGAGARARATVLPPADGLITNTPGLVLLACFADCVPLLAFDPVRRAVGVAHAGWRGTVADMGGALVRALGEHYASDPADLRVVIGPSAGPCCYAVGDEVVTAAAPAFGSALLHRDDQVFFDLWAANRAALERAGVPGAQIETAGVCTITHADRFFSHRATGGATGRFGAIIGLRG